MRLTPTKAKKLSRAIASFIDAVECHAPIQPLKAVTHKASTTEQSIEAIARRLEPALRKRFLAAVQQAASRIDIEALARSIQAGQLTQAEMATKLREWPETFGGLSIDLLAGFLAGAALAYEVIDGSSFKLRFDLINPHAVQYATQHMPKITQSYVAGAKEMIADITRQSVSGKYTVWEAAKLIKDYIGLTPKYATAVENYKATLLADGVSGERLDTKVARYTEQLLKSRAMTIARTEIIQAEVEGQRALWEEAAKEGLFDRHTATRIWHVAQDERTCPLCASMEGQEIPFGGTYTNAELGDVNVFGEPIDGPPLHPQCRCWEELNTQGAS